MLRFLDTHQHLVYPDRFGYGWAAGTPALAARAFTVEDYKEVTRGQGIAGTIFMEAAVDGDDHHAEARWVAELAKRPGSGILGLIASIRPERTEGLESWLDEGPELGVVGYRRILHQTDDQLSRSDIFRESVRRIGARGMPFDMCFAARQLPIALELARACPDTVFVLDHCGGPDIATGTAEPWRQGVADLAAMPNVFAKLSGLFDKCAPGTATLETVRPYVEQVVDAFGPDRCLWGSDWPVVLLGADLPTWIAVSRRIFSGYSIDEATAMAHGTAARIYAVRLPDAVDPHDDPGCGRG